MCRNFWKFQNTMENLGFVRQGQSKHKGAANYTSIKFSLCLSMDLDTLCKYMSAYIFIFIQLSMLCMLSHFSHVWLFATLCSIDCQAPLSMGFSRQEYWSGLPFPPSGDLPDWGIKPTSLMSPELAGRYFTISTTWEALKRDITWKFSLSEWQYNVNFY